MPRCAHCKKDGTGRHDTVAQVRTCAVLHEDPDTRMWDRRDQAEADAAFMRAFGRRQSEDPPF